MSVAPPIPADLVERYREVAFVVLLSVGALLFALGIAFLVIGASVGTAPPAPYMTPTDKYALVAVSLAGCAAGLLLVRAAGRVVGW